MLTLKTESPVPVELATTTFAPLAPANDNVPGPSAYLRGPHDPEYADRGLYVGLRRGGHVDGYINGDVGEPPRYGGDSNLGLVVVHPGTRPASTDSGQFRGDNPHMEKTPEERLPGALSLLAARHGYVYLGSPYSKYEAGHDAAACVVADAAATLMRRGLVIYSPIAHGHAIAVHGLPFDWAFWKAQCQPLVDAAAGLIVLTMEGWQESVGLQYEIEEFVRTEKPILHVSPAWLAASEVGRMAA